MASINDAGLPSITSILPMPKGSVESTAALHSFAGSPRQNTEESASQSLHALVQVEEQRLQREEQRTRQENLKLDQRRVEQSMLREILDAGVPPHLIPLIFVGNDGSSIQTYAAMLEHTSQESALPDRLPSHSQITSNNFAASSLRPCQMQSAPFSQPRYPSPPATAKGRAYSVFENSQKAAVRNRSYSFVDTGRSASASNMAPPSNRNSQYSRPSFSARPQYFDQSARPQPQGQSGQSLVEPYALQRQAVTSSAARSYSVPDASNRYFSGAKHIPTSTAHQPRSINFCHWKPPTETKHASESPKASLVSVQQSAVNHKGDGGGISSHTGKRKASHESNYEGSTSHKKPMRHSNSPRDIRHHGFDPADTSSRRRESLIGIDEQCSGGEGTQSPRIPDTSSNLHVNMSYTDTAPKSPRSKPTSPDIARLPNRRRQDKPEAAGGKMNIRFVDGLTPQKSLPHSRNYVLDTSGPQTGGTNRTSSNGSQRPQQFAFVTGHSMTGVGGSSPLVNSALHDMSARRGSMPV